MSHAPHPSLSLPALPQGAPAAISRQSRPCAIIARATLGASLLFMVLPAIDLWVTGLFASEGRFPLTSHAFLTGFRQLGLNGPIIVAVLMLGMLALHLVWPKLRLRMDPQKPLFVFLGLAVGQLIVEIIEPLVGRARARPLVEFGGIADFTPAWQIAGECSRNCSFPSGEASSTAALLSLLVFVPPRLRACVALVLVPVLGLIAFNRVMFGAHFVSDVAISWLLTMLAMAKLLELMEMLVTAQLSCAPLPCQSGRG